MSDRERRRSPERPRVNLGYACLCSELRNRKPTVFTNRGCIKKTFVERGLKYVSALALQNVQDLLTTIHWNKAHEIYLFRVSSSLFPWNSEYSLDDLPDANEIKILLGQIGKIATEYNQRLTSHPDHFVKIGSPKPEVCEAGLATLERHSLLFDLMGFKPSPYNKINIHIGGVYGDKSTTLTRFKASVLKMSPNLRKRLTVENDDIPNSYSVDDLYPMASEMGIPIVFDLHHIRFCKGVWSNREALDAALSTWPTGIRPVVHWSESQERRKPLAHSDYVDGPLDLYGVDISSVDVMIEAKAKEQALLRVRTRV